MKTFHIFRHPYEYYITFVAETKGWKSPYEIHKGFRVFFGRRWERSEVPYRQRSSNKRLHEFRKWLYDTYGDEMYFTGLYFGRKDKKQ